MPLTPTREKEIREKTIRFYNATPAQRSAQEWNDFIISLLNAELDKRNKEIESLWGKPNKCELCKGNESRFEWSNKDHKYTTNKEDWWMLCARCHRKYDRKNNSWDSWNKGESAKDHPALQKALDMAHEAARGQIAWNRNRKEIPCSSCGKTIIRRPCELIYKSYYCSKECKKKGILTT